MLPAFRTAWSTANSWASPVPTAPCSKHPQILHFGDQMQQEIKLRECQKRRQELSRSDNWPSAPLEDNKLFPSPGGQPRTHSLPLQEGTWLGTLEKCSFILSPGRQSKGTLLTAQELLAAGPDRPHCSPDSQAASGTTGLQWIWTADLKERLRFPNSVFLQSDCTPGTPGRGLSSLASPPLSHTFRAGM